MKAPPRYYGMNNAMNPAVGVMAAISYALYLGRGNSTQAKGIDTWERVKNCIANAALDAETVDDYIGKLGRLLDSPTLSPNLLAWVVSPKPGQSFMVYHVPAIGKDLGDSLQEAFDPPVVVRLTPSTGDIQQIDSDQSLAYGSYRTLIADACARMRCTEDTLLEVCRGDRALIIASLCQLRNEESKKAKVEPPKDNAIAVSAEVL